MKAPAPFDSYGYRRLFGRMYPIARTNGIAWQSSECQNQLAEVFQGAGDCLRFRWSVEEERAKAVCPLFADGDCRGEYKYRRSDTPQYLQAEQGLPATVGFNDV